MKIAVTGASGFVGRHVLANLVGRNIDVVAVTRDASSLQGLSRSIRIVEMDISAPPQDCFESMGCPDELIHLAWGELSNYQSLAHFETVLPAHYRFLKSLIQSGLSSLLVTGTCLEYGMQSGQLSEEDTRCQHTPYGYAKHALRTQLELFHKIHHFCLKWARLFYMFGEGQSKRSIFQMLKSAAENGMETFAMSGGEQKRDYLPVEAVASTLVDLVTRRQESFVVNVCSGNPVSLRCQVDDWIKKNGWTITPSYGIYPYSDYEPMAFWGDRSRLDSILKN